MKPFKALVMDAGGGEIRLFIDRAAPEYPRIGDEVRVTFIRHPERAR